MKPLIAKALQFAAKAHKGQKRKYDNTQYIVHPLRVAIMVQDAGGDDNMIAAALLHDTVEDTETTSHDIYAIFGYDIGELVYELTEQFVEGNRAFRKQVYKNHLAGATDRAKTIKLADLIDNTRDIVLADPKFAKVYMAEKRELLTVLGEGDKVLFDQASKQVEDYFNG